MGDRANIVIEKDESGDFPHAIFFYTHGHGSIIKQRLQTALKRSEDRWTDGSYLARIIFCDLIGLENHDKLTGFGISTAFLDGGHPLLCVNIMQQKVKLRESYEDPESKVIKEWTFEEYADASFDPEK